MKRLAALTVLTGAVLVGGLGSPAAADPGIFSGEPTVVCVRTDGGGGQRQGICVWIPVGR